jgi:hypothetical protein
VEPGTAFAFAFIFYFVLLTSYFLLFLSELRAHFSHMKENISALPVFAGGLSNQ